MDELQQSLQQEIAQLIVDTLNLDIQATDIKADKPLFGNEGLGLDSIDALELALALSEKYGIELKSEDAQRFQIFANLTSLTAYVNQHKKD